MNHFGEILQNNLPKLFAVFSILSIAIYTYIWVKVASHFENIPQKKENSHEPISVSVIIPFRNESDRISPLLNSILNLNNNEFIEFLFIDDHSTDNSQNTIKNHPVYSKIDCKLFQLDSNESGKKMAILKGINEAKNNIILTTDADCEFQPNTITELYSTFINNQIHLLIAPVFFKTKQHNLIQNYQKIENTVLVALGFYQNKTQKPTMANGANLMYNKSIFLQLNPFQNNLKIAGGDDIFTLEAFYQFDPQKVQWTTNAHAAVYSTVLDQFSELWHQRIRWVKKTIHQSTQNTAKSQIFLALFFILFWGFTLYSLVFNHYEIATILWLGKAISDLFSIRIIFQKFNQPIQNSQIIWSSIFQNFFIPALGIAVPFKKIHWKNRKF